MIDFQNIFELNIQIYHQNRKIKYLWWLHTMK